MNQDLQIQFQNKVLFVLFLSAGLGLAGTVGCSKVAFSVSNDSVTTTDATGVVATTTSTTTETAIPSNFTGGFYAQTPNFVIPGYSNNGSRLSVTANYAKTLSLAMGVCQRFAYGYADCGIWLAGAHDFVLYSENGTSLKMIIRSLPVHLIGDDWNAFAPHGFRNQMLGFLGLPGEYYGHIHDPLVLDVEIIQNKNHGFEVDSKGPSESPASSMVFQLVSPEGRLDENSWSFTLLFAGQPIFTGQAIHCQSRFCGLDAGYFNGNY